MSSAEQVQGMGGEKTSKAKRRNTIQESPATAVGFEKMAPSVDLSDPNLYLNRELTWLEFNRRVLHEASDPRSPLLERIKFAAIAGSNLDEFFMKRIGGLKQQLGAGVNETTVDGRTPRQQLEACYVVIGRQQKEKESLLGELWSRLREEGIELLHYDDLSAADKAGIRDDYYNNIFPLMTPQSIDPAHPFPFISNLSLNLLVTLRYPQEEETSLARVKIPVGAGAPRFIPVPANNHGFQRFVLLEDVVANNLDLLFPGMEILGCDLFRVTRNANTSRNEEHADDLLAMIESALQDRKFAPVVRLQIRPGMNPIYRGRLAAELGLNEDTDLFEVEGMMGMRDLWQIYHLDMPHLKEPKHKPADHPVFQTEGNILHAIREAKAILLQHPYESFSSSVERFLNDVASDPKVLAIKMTLYRTSPRSPLIDTLIRAAQNGKQVAVVVELQASFDEEINIRLANRMEEAGIHVTYGVVGLKTHCKVILVVRQDFNGLRRYVHFGTGNYHSETARVYSDLGLFVYDREIGKDTTELFNYLTTGYTPKRHYSKLLPAPKILKKTLLEKIAREIAASTSESPGHLIFKMNALEDEDVARALYEASQAGVRVDLIVRDSCRIRPGLPGLSEHIRVVSIVGRFLEHARAYYFANGGQEEIYIGSADAMRRNLENRVEILVPVEVPSLINELKMMLKIQLDDRRNAWDMQSDGSYVQRTPLNEAEQRGSQQALIDLAEQRSRDASRLRKRKARSPGRNLR